jgi:hypothetical protein
MREHVTPVARETQRWAGSHANGVQALHTFVVVAHGLVDVSTQAASEEEHLQGHLVKVG